MPRYVILTHDFPTLHWDFMLEKEAALRTWRLARQADSSGEFPAEPLNDHRLDYLEYEGPVSGDRGAVTRWDRGDYSTIVEREGFIELDLRGDRLVGRAVLQKAPDDDGWRFYFTASSVRPV